MSLEDWAQDMAAAAEPVAPESVLKSAPEPPELKSPEPQLPEPQPTASIAPALRELPLPRSGAISLEDWAADMVTHVPDAIDPSMSPIGILPAQSRAQSEALWYLGLDFGTTGISAVLLNRSTCHLYPLYWTEPPAYLAETRASEPSQGLPSEELRFRLPSVISLQTADPAAGHLRDFKPCLKLGIPYQNGDRWEPQVQWSDTLRIPLSQITQALQSLLASLMESAQALELEAALPSLAGVAIGCPAHWSEAYRFNLRQAVIEARLVAEPEQVYCIEDSIAALLSTLNSSDGREIVLPQNSQRNTASAENSEPGNTLVLVAGAMTTELTLVRVSGKSPNLAHEEFQIRSIPFAGQAITQDIICQLIYPMLHEAPGHSRSFWPEEPGELRAEDFRAEAIDRLIFQDLKLPTAGEPDLVLRTQLQQRLESCRSGQLLLEAAQYIKLTLQQQSRCSLKLGNDQQVVLRQDLGSQVLLPYIQRLNRELNALLTEVDLTVTDINQVICTGGTASLGAIARWLRQKLPNATITQDTYRSVPNRCISSCSRIAYGLALLPLHPQLRDQAQMGDRTPHVPL
ncbi:MAG: hypothetical protein HY785_15785 [Oscillatoriophycideae cyanobacterium NC_groundwater_1537_Pr4_S-0.65um_50_18]|nr:hypothetical protein [Oscillatoriophycideae cyanobacterium NC_groundwater_1537_Pr4_S-0.65um_50_18]